MSQLLQVATRNGGISTIDGGSAPEHVDQGIPYDLPDVAVDLSGAVDHYQQGLPFTAQGRLAVTQDSPTYYGNGTAPFSGLRLCMTTDAATHVATGIPYGPNGGIAVSGLDPNGVRITQQPTSWFGPEFGTTDTFNVVAESGDLSPIIYQWEELIASVWTNAIDGTRASGSTGAGATTASYVVSNVQFPDNAQQFRCLVNNDTNNTTSTVVSLNLTGGTFFIVTQDGQQIITQVGTTEPTVTEESL